LIRFALPTGDMRNGTASFLAERGLASEEYASAARTYRPRSDRADDCSFRVFRDRDIPIQVALGNYDLGVCSSAAVDELLSRHPNEAIHQVSMLPFYTRNLYVVGGKGKTRTRIVSEYPGLAQVWALRQRIGSHHVLPVSGSPEHYPPEDADMAVVSVDDNGLVHRLGLPVVDLVARSSACLVANGNSLASQSVGRFLSDLPVSAEESIPRARFQAADRAPSPGARGLRLALPDGHQQREAPAVCRAAGLEISGYDEVSGEARPVAGDGIDVKVIRPQDMPQFVALGSFDVAITGRDCLQNHLAQFPSSPVEEVVDLGRQRYRWAAVAASSLGASSLAEALDYWRGNGRKVIRIATEYPNIADHFARDRRLSRYSVVPVVGASEGFVPEDAELLIEGSETGRTWQANDLVPLEWLFESTMVVIANKRRSERPRAAQVEALVQRFQRAA
jgi:ATP phosphoribosyltransferase